MNPLGRADVEPTVDAARESGAIARCLRGALELTERMLRDEPTLEGLVSMVSERELLLESVNDARASGGSWGTHEVELAERIRAADDRLLARVWRAHADAFEWLRGRDESIEAAFPSLVALHHASSLAEPTEHKAAGRASAATVRAAAECYERTRAGH